MAYSLAVSFLTAATTGLFSGRWLVPASAVMREAISGWSARASSKARRTCASRSLLRGIPPCVGTGPRSGTSRQWPELTAPAGEGLRQCGLGGRRRLRIAVGLRLDRPVGRCRPDGLGFRGRLWGRSWCFQGERFASGGFEMV